MSAFSHKKNAEKKMCDLCDFKCSKQSDWNRHILTLKHTNRTNSNKIEHTLHTFDCKVCKKQYKVRNSLWYHEQKCKIIKEGKEDINIPTIVSEVSNLSNIVVELIKSNTDLQKQMLEVCKNNTTTNINNNIFP